MAVESPPHRSASSSRRFEIRCLGGFEVWYGERRVTGFESRKVRALAAYLFRHRDRALERDHLAALLWPDRSTESARRNLRQALYNLKSSLEAVDESGQLPLEIETGTVRADPDRRVWVDADQFEAALETFRRQRSSVQSLTEAVQLYRGDFLAGISIGDSIAFEEWLVEEQERLRQAALAALHRMVQHHLENRSWALGIQYCHQLLRIDPLSEESHRTLMRLYALAGRRSRAIVQYQELTRLLDEELGVEPLDETRALHESIRADDLPLPQQRIEADPTGPMVPLVGRDREQERLSVIWPEVLRRGARVTWLLGPTGIGKSRLAKSAVHRLASDAGPTVLRGKADGAPRRALGTFRDAFQNACAYEPEVAERLLSEAPREMLRQLSRIVPRLTELDPVLAENPPDPTTDPQELARSALEFLEILARVAPESGRRGLILLLDDLHRADRATLDLIARIPQALGSAPVWVLAAADGDEPPVAVDGDESLRLGPLGDAELHVIARSLLDDPEAADRLGRLLILQCDGSPLAVTGWINLLWDLMLLTARSDGGWSLDPVLEPEAVLARASTDEVARARIEQLPPSTRRLAVLAAIAGPRFDSDLLHRTEGEEPEVVAANLGVLLKRWLVRVDLGYWADSRHDRDLALWSSGAHSHLFEYAHDHLAEAVREIPGPERLMVIHRRIADALARRGDTEPAVLAHHYLAARAHERALPHLIQSARDAADLGAWDLAREAYDQALDALDAIDRQAEERGAPRIDATEREALYTAMAELPDA